MPYIKDEDKTKFEDLIKIAENIDSAGEMNYVITMLVLYYYYPITILLLFITILLLYYFYIISY